MTKLLRTKTTWAGIALIATAIGLAVGGEITWVDALPRLVEGFAIIFVRQAIAKLKP